MTVWRIVLLAAGGVLVGSAVYVERRRTRYDSFVQLLAGPSFAGGAAAVALAAAG